MNLEIKYKVVVDDDVLPMTFNIDVPFSDFDATTVQEGFWATVDLLPCLTEGDEPKYYVLPHNIISLHAV